MLLKLKAKVSIFTSEQQMETHATYDLGNVASSQEWAWRSMAIPVENVAKVVAFNDAKTLVYDENEAPILVWEKFEDVYVKWRTALYEYHNTVDTKANEESKEENPKLGEDEEE